MIRSAQFHLVIAGAVVGLAAGACTTTAPQEGSRAERTTVAPATRAATQPASRVGSLSVAESAPTTRVAIAGKDVVVELATRDQARQRGLGGRTSLAADRGMLFLYRTADSHYFWMKDCLIGLDILYLADDGTVIGLATLPAPTPGAPESAIGRFPSPGPCRIVLELAAGQAAARGVHAGSQIVLPANLRLLCAGADP